MVLFCLTPSALMDTYSFSLPVGSGSGTSFVLEGDEAITAVRVWERDSSYIYGSVSPSPPSSWCWWRSERNEGQRFASSLCLSRRIQLRFGYIWSKVAGRVSGTMHELQLFPGERLIQVSGAAHTYCVTTRFCPTSLEVPHALKISEWAFKSFSGALKIDETQNFPWSFKFIDFAACWLQMIDCVGAT